MYSTFSVINGRCRIMVLNFDLKLAWHVSVSRQWFAENDPGHAVSIGFVLGQDITPGQFRHFDSRGKVTPIDYTAATAPRPW